jgi:hypothetical protein
MVSVKAEITEPVRVELRVGNRTINREYEPGVVVAKDDDDCTALDHLLATGIAKPVAKAAKGKAAERSDD